MFWFRKPEKRVEKRAGDSFRDRLLSYSESEESMRIVDAEIIGIWEELRDWFSGQGYTLYELKHYGFSHPTQQTDEDPLKWSGGRDRKDEPPEWPYAYYGGDTIYQAPIPLLANLTNKVCFAQDLQGRHVAIKRLEVLDDTEEIRINRWLYEHKEDAEKNCILPIIEILEHEGQTFAIMPRWGESPCEIYTLGEIMKFIHCLLKAINFLHTHRIVHRDITEGNILVNHFCSYWNTQNNWLRPLLQSNGHLTYALFDFDLSLMLSPGQRLPAWRSFEIRNIIWPHDTHQGELDYDPFLFEMGCVGIQLCVYYQHCIPMVPMLAPFLDRLITDNLDERFKSSQALSFFEQMYKELTPAQLATSVTPRTYIQRWKPGEHDRWHGLPTSFLEKWGCFRATEPTLYIRILRRVCRTHWGYWFVQGVRRIIIRIWRPTKSSTKLTS